MTKISDPITIGQVEIKNRYFAAPMVTNWGNYWGGITETVINSYEQRAKGGFGLVCIEATTVDRRTTQFTHMLTLSHDKYLTDFNKVAEVIHRWGAKAVVQLQHGGSRSSMNLCDTQLWGDCTPLAPSANTPEFPGKPLMREITTEELEEIIEAYVKSVKLAKAAGMDGVLLHYTHGFLGHQMLSPWTNRRTDKWGTHEGKILWCTEIIRRAREAVGTDFIIGARIPGEDNLDAITAMVNPKAKSDAEKYLTLEMMVKEIVPQLVEAGLDYLDVTSGQLEAVHHFIPILYYPRGHLVKYAEEVKKHVSIPVVGGGKIMDPAHAEMLVEKGKLDAVFLCRGAIADPEFAGKALSGRSKEIRRCICCDHCTVRLFKQYEVKCAVNPDIGPIRFQPIKQVFKPKKVLVIGGGVAGMEAARLADLSGHKVTLVEKREKLGGMVSAVSSLTRLYTRDLRNIIDWQEHQLSKLSVKVKLKTKATAETVKQMKPDAVILATGSYFNTGALKGANRRIATTLDAVLRGETSVGEKVVVIGGALGAELILSLAREGKQMTVLEEGPERGVLKEVNFVSGLASGPWMYLYRSLYIFDELAKLKNVTVLPNIKIKEITANGVVCSKGDGVEHVLEADTVIVATGHQSNKPIRAEELRDVVPEVYEIGDCVIPGQIKDAIYTAHQIVRDVLNREF
jgi:2,4-dienoyl-CoA reductase-like NADH-dependent reductase (Old Yellow Enzyme family)/thioredoxin reductase